MISLVDFLPIIGMKCTFMFRHHKSGKLMTTGEACSYNYKNFSFFAWLALIFGGYISE